MGIKHQTINRGLRNWCDLMLMKFYNYIIGRKYNVEGLYISYILNVFEEYTTSKRKILIVGQNDIMRVNLKKAAEKRLLYDDLSNEALEFRNGEKLKDKTFWNFCHELNSKINGNSHLGFVYTNLIKLNGKDGNEDEWKFEKFIRPMISLLSMEIFEIEPEVIVFMTGQEYDKYINFALPFEGDEVKLEEVEGYDIKDFASFKFSDRQSYRIHPPEYLKSRGLVDIYMNELVELIKL
ncbi:MAG: hypothetical protein JXA68_09745 [Ignavibacteriales bacterium]|nr:hypothetical protein [Ignavibacteriales bacterium]